MAVEVIHHIEHAAEHTGGSLLLSLGKLAKVVVPPIAVLVGLFVISRFCSK